MLVIVQGRLGFVDLNSKPQNTSDTYGSTLSLFHYTRGFHIMSFDPKMGRDGIINGS